MRPSFNSRGRQHRHHGGHGPQQSFGFTDPRQAFGMLGGSPFEPPAAHFEPPFPPAPPGFPPGPGWPGADAFGRGGHGGRRSGHGGEHEGRSRGPGRRQRRGNVRAAVLALLTERPMHGYEMIQELTARTGGLWRPSPGSVYPTLQLLADEGLVSTTEEASGKKLFTLTESGRIEATKQGTASAPWEDVAQAFDPVDLRLRTSYGQLHTAVLQISQAGTSDQKARAIEALGEARRRIYALLAEDVPEDAVTDDHDEDTSEED